MGGNDEGVTQVSGVVVGVLDVNLRRGGVMGLEMPVHHIGALVVVIGRQVHVFRRENRQSDDTKGHQAGRHAPRNPQRHVAKYIGTRPARLTEEIFRKTSGEPAAHHR